MTKTYQLTEQERKAFQSLKVQLENTQAQIKQGEQVIQAIQGASQGMVQLIISQQKLNESGKGESSVDPEFTTLTVTLPDEEEVPEEKPFLVKR